MSEGIRPELMLNDGRWDIGRLIGDELVDRFGFEAEPDWDGVFQRVVDSQHAVIVTIGDWGRVPGGGSTMPSPRFGVARRDINELWHHLLNDRVRRWRRTVREHPWFFGREPVSFLTSSHEPVDVTRWMDEWIPRLVAETPSWSFVKAHMELTANLPTKSGRMKAHVPRMMTALMSGWNDEAEEEFLAPMVAQLDEAWDSDLDGSIRRGKIDRVRAWIAEHPDGVERELID